MRATLLIPTLNEGESIGHVLDSFQNACAKANRTLFAAAPVDWDVIVIDGASTDGTGRIAREKGAHVLVERRRGYGRAYRTGLEQANGDIIATLDGDGTYPTEAIPGLAKKLLDERLDFITCNRFAGLAPGAMTTEHRVGNWLLNTTFRIAFNRYLRGLPSHRIVDSQSGMWVFRRDILSRLRLTQEGMPFSEEIKLEVLINGLRLEEVPIRYSERWGAPKLSSWIDGRENLFFLVRKRLRLARSPLSNNGHRLAEAREPVS